METYIILLQEKENEISELKKQHNLDIAELKKEYEDKISKLDTRINSLENKLDKYYDYFISNKETILTLEESSNTEKSTFDSKLNAFLRYKKREVFIELITEYPDKISEILENSITCLPKDIDELAKKYSFVDKLSIIKEKITNIDKLKKGKNVDINNTYNDLCDSYMIAFNTKKPTLIKKYIRQLYIMYPDLFDTFLKVHSKYLPDDIDNILDKIKEEFNTKPEKIIKLEKKQKADYKNSSIEYFVDFVKNVKNNPKQRALLILKHLIKNKRTQEDINLFKTNINKLFKKPI